jgi:FkbM family methyltransferase
MEFPFRPAFFGLINEIFFRPFVYFEKSEKPLVIFDCGTNIGIRLLYFKWRFPNSKFVCFEPNPVVLGYLEKNIKNNGLAHRVELNQIALGRDDGFIELFYNSNVRASGSASVIKPEVLNTTQVSKRVPQKRLSDFISAKVDLLKIDIEGAEGEVVEDLKNNNKLSYIKKVLIEYHYDGVTMIYPLENIISKLESSGMKCKHSKLEAFRPDRAGPVLRTCMIYGER